LNAPDPHQFQGIHFVDGSWSDEGQENQRGKRNANPDGDIRIHLTGQVDADQAERQRPKNSCDD
jgi:hypothetical protein